VSNTSAGDETVASESPVTPGDDEPLLAMPEGWVIDDLARQRMTRQLVGAPDHIRGVAAETGALPPGASYRVHAERRCLRPFSDAWETSDCVVQGAALLRPGVAFEARDSLVEVEQGSLLVDPGAHVHDPWREVPPLQPASPLGRPPFPRRPLVVFLACEPDVEALDWARSLVNNLVRRDVEGRLAMHDVAEGLHLTQPCLPSEESIRALSPDVVVALDQAALDQAPGWCGTDRTAVAIEFTPDVAATAEPISWQLGRARGRVRARIGRRVDPPSLVSLVNRLCSGPHPLPPTDAATPATAVVAVRALLTWRSTPTPESATRRFVTVITRDRSPEPGDQPLDGLVDYLRGAGHDARMCLIGNADLNAARAADLVVIDSPGDYADVRELIQTRRREGRPTIAYVAPGDLSCDSPSEALQLTPETERLAMACGNVTTTSTAIHAGLRAQGRRTHLLPVLLTRNSTAELRSARADRNRYSDPVVGWYVGSTKSPIPDSAEAVAAALQEVLDERHRLTVEIVGDASRVPSRFPTHPRVTLRPGRPGADGLTSWTMQVWNPPLVGGGVADDTRPLVEASAVGVPTVLPEPVRAVCGYPPPGCLVADFRLPDDWIAPIRSLLDNEQAWSRRSRDAIHRFDVMDGPAACDIAVNRFLGWALYESEQP
jgi:hypothetical protein